MSNETAVVICRSATHFLRLGYVRGYRCQVCGAELQVSSAGVDQIAAGGVPMCRACGGLDEEGEKARRRRSV